MNSGLMKKWFAPVCLAAAFNGAAAYAHNTCGNAELLSAGNTTVTMASTTLDGTSPSCGSAVNRDVWYRYAAGQTGLAVFDVSGNNNAQLSAFTACPGSGGTLIQCQQSSRHLELNVTSGTTYTIRLASTDTLIRTLTTAFYTTPANDTCNTPIAISQGDTYTYSPAAAGTDTLSSCGDEAGTRDLWYTYTAPRSGIASIEVSGSSLVMMSVFDGCGGSEVLCDAAVPHTPNQIDIPVTSGATYYVRVALRTGSLITSRTLSVFDPPGNDTCATATEVGPGAHTISVRNATAHPPYASCGLAGDPTQRDVWLAYTASQNGMAVFDVTTGQAVTIGVFNSCSAGASSLVCASPESNDRWWACLAVTAGQKYWVRYGYPGSHAEGSIGVEITEFATSPLNESCATAQVLPAPGTYPWNNAGACDNDPFENNALGCLASNRGHAAIWFKYTPGTDGTVVFKTSGSNIQTVLEAYSGSCGGPVIGCNDEHQPLFRTNSHLPVAAQANVPIYLRLAQNVSISAYVGHRYVAGDLSVELIPAVANDNCASATPILPGQLGTAVEYDNLNATNSSGVPSTGACYPGGTAQRDVWFSFTAPQTGTILAHTCHPPLEETYPPLLDNHETLLSVYATCGGAQIACSGNVDTSHTLTPICYEGHSKMAFGVTAGSTYRIRAASRGELFGYGTITLDYLTDTSTPVSLPGSAIVLDGDGPLEQIDGTMNEKVFLYQINICDHENFFATTVNAYTNVDTGLMLFDSAGRGVVLNDDYILEGAKSTITGDHVSSDGVYYLAISVRPRRDGAWPLANGQRIWNVNPYGFTGERVPDGPGAGGVLTGWELNGGGSPGGGLFRIELGGTCYPAAACPADFNGDDNRDVADLFAYINAWLAKTANADFNDSGNVDVADLFAYINAWLAGC